MEALQTSKALLEKAKDKLEAAKYLFEGEFYEDCVSRAYYSMHNAAKATLAMKNVKARGHKGVLQMFGLHIIRQHHIEDYYGKALKFAKEEREKSDYEIFTQISKEEAEEVLNDAEKFLARIEKAMERIGENKKNDGEENDNKI